jgi:hypothetical protein
MPFDGSRIRVAGVSAVDSVSSPRPEFQRPERVVVLSGALAVGSLAGFALAMAVGPMNLWLLAAVTAPLLLLALHLTSRTLEDAISREAHGCAAAAALHGAALLAWPLTGLLTPLSPLSFWIAPVLALATLVLSASCWGGSPRTVYRLMGQGLLMATLAAHQGTILFMGA